MIERLLARLPHGARAVALAGILAGLAAFWLTLPPLHVRTPIFSVLLGLVAIGLGCYAVARDAKRLGWGAIVAGAAGIGFGYLATRSSVAHLDQVVVWSALFAAMLRYATPLAFAAMGGIFSERSGVTNIGLEGMMLSGAFFGILAADKLESWQLGLGVAALSGALFALVHAFFAIHMRADQIVGGFAINFLALGVTGYLFIDIYGGEGTPPDIPEIPDVHLSFLKDWYFVGPILGQLNLMIWLALATVVLSWLVLFKTPVGLRLRAVGEHPRAADTVGISVYGTRYAAVVALGRARRARRRVPLDRLRQLLQPEHDGRTGLHRARRRDLRQLATVPGRRVRPSLRLLERARPTPAGVFGVRRGPLPGASLRAHVGRGRRCDRPLDPARSGWSSLPEAVTGLRGPAAPGSPSSSAYSRWPPCRQRSSRPAGPRRTS